MNAMAWSKWEDAFGLGFLAAGVAVILGYLMRPSHDGQPLDINTILEVSSDVAVADFNLLVYWTIGGFVIGAVIGVILFVKMKLLQEIA